MRISRPVVILAAVGAALVLNLAIYAIGGAAGAAYTFPGPDGAAIPWFVVAVFSVAPLGLALTVVALLAPRRRWVIPAALVAAPMVLAVSIPLMPLAVGFDTATALALAAMHVALVPITVLALLGLRRATAPAYAASRSTIGSSASA